MSTLTRIDLLTLFDLYLIVVFVLWVVLRYRQYRSIILFIRKVPDRWPNLFKVIKEEKALFINWGVLLPVISAFALMLIHGGLHRLVWVKANISLEDLSQHWPWIVFAVVSGLAMIGFDIWMISSGGRFDEEAVEKQLEQAEFWLSSWASTAVSVVTLGMVKPKKMVRKELKKALGNAIKALDRMLKFWVYQIIIRFVFGFSLWIAWLSLVKK